MAIEDSIRLLDQALQTNRPAYYASLRPGLDENGLADAERELGRSLPAELRALYRWRNGQFMETGHRFYGTWSFQSISDAMDVVRTNDELARDGVFEGEPLWWDGRWTPFLTDGSDNYQCVDPLGSYEGGVQGQILVYFATAHRREVTFPNLESLVNALTAASAALTSEATPESLEAPAGYPRRIVLPFSV